MSLKIYMFACLYHFRELQVCLPGSFRFSIKSARSQELNFAGVTLTAWFGQSVAAISSFWIRNLPGAHPLGSPSLDTLRSILFSQPFSCTYFLYWRKIRRCSFYSIRLNSFFALLFYFLQRAVCGSSYRSIRHSSWMQWRDTVDEYSDQAAKKASMQARKASITVRRRFLYATLDGT